ncbi:MAG: HAMP domain-containing histidine kinase [Clostridiaceae bacterium]|nr:HAMP domain-containing histidine kinase [Clostridiaceae bacterium]
MDRKNLLFKRKIRYFFVLLVIFIAAFSVFGLLVFRNAEAALFAALDDQYAEAEALVRENPVSSLANFISGRNIVFTSQGTYTIGSRIFILVRDTDGRLLNAEPLKYFEYLNDITFSPSEQFRTHNQSIFRRGSTIYYRIHTFSLTTGQEPKRYVQMATEVTETVNTLETVRRSMLGGMVIVVLVSAIASWIIGQMLVRFVADAWEEQDLFIAHASHELRSPLTVVHNSLELLLQEPGKRVIDNSKLILNALSETNRMRKVTANLLNMARLESDQGDLPRELFDLSLLIKEITTPFIYQAEAGGKTITVHASEGLMAYGYRQDLGEMVVLLLENALKYTEAGDQIEVWLQGDSDRLIFRVKDTGVGISDDNMGKIFTRFYRGDRARGMAEGSGLGLNIVSTIVSRHQGSIKASHNLPKGTVFTVVLPSASVARER